eukprot:CAMPEP_0119469754 /NCGR_PEP_ID=MMETSP1344-20130328/2945_1 /TAXON_ID=236787 /ORGANISM="Florenciella parvula, Strain CCMP2471" /LENGTH=151 /DNA_ID=CAMNT_0007502345 /DNA_START=306 /DNA_END=760 /DNA_ORIENTATION=+
MPASTRSAFRAALPAAAGFLPDQEDVFGLFVALVFWLLALIVVACVEARRRLAQLAVRALRAGLLAVEVQLLAKVALVHDHAEVNLTPLPVRALRAGLLGVEVQLVAKVASGIDYANIGRPVLRALLHAVAALADLGGVCDRFLALVAPVG